MNITRCNMRIRVHTYLHVITSIDKRGLWQGLGAAAPGRSRVRGAAAPGGVQGAESLAGFLGISAS